MVAQYAITGFFSLLIVIVGLMYKKCEFFFENCSKTRKKIGFQFFFSSFSTFLYYAKMTAPVASDEKDNKINELVEA